MTAQFVRRTSHRPGWRDRVRAVRQKQVLQILQDTPPQSVTVLSSMTEVPERTLFRWLTGMVAAGDVVRIWDGCHKRTVRYTVRGRP